ncbi:YckD family protein [Salipaludibacillus sp. CF4.18]|uniref:YckD family protein n=1 Tax=Salipaludibacillus sp. CF4.18 TaxID=3373081 RepID=UPI003EE81829
MVKYLLGFLAVCMLSVATLSAPVSAAEDIKEVELTEDQRMEMSLLQKDAIERKKEIINKYVEYGVFTEEKAQKMQAHMDEKFSELEENGFIPDCEMSKKHSEQDENN